MGKETTKLLHVNIETGLIEAVLIKEFKKYDLNNYVEQKQKKYLSHSV